MKELLCFLNSIYPLSEGVQQYLSSVLKTKEFERKEFLLKKGHVAKNIYFMAKGLVRCFYMENGNEVSSWFMKEGDVVISVESFLGQKPSYESIQALEPCSVYYITYEQLMHTYQTYLEFNIIGRILTERYYVLCEQRLYSLRMQKSVERYSYLRENFPELVQRVQSQYLASYLGIATETLSRIKSKR